MSDDLETLFTAVCDDAAVFPPGNLPLAEAVTAHAGHEAAAHAGVVGAFVLAAKDLPELAPLVEGFDRGSFRLSLTVPLSRVGSALAVVEEIVAVRLEALEVTLAADEAPDDVVPTLDEALAGRRFPVFVELPRDARRADVIEALSGTAYQAKLRTGGVRADLYPDTQELAEAVVALTAARVPFKATAGLHHALRNTDPTTGFDQHGFLNLLAATGAALEGADATEVARLLADRRPEHVVTAVLGLDPVVRDWFRSFGTCSIAEPVEDLVALGLLPADYLMEVPS